MKAYPTIPNSLKLTRGVPCFAFRKYDGSNLRFLWDKKKGWLQFGTRTRLFDVNDPDFGKAIPMFKERFAEPLAHLFSKTLKCDEAIAYCEWWGPKSFAGDHEPDDTMSLTLLDVNVHKKGFISPQSFVDIFPNIVPTAEVVYTGNLTDDYITGVRAQPDGEGVVCKGGEGHKLWMCKIKTDAYKERLKEKYADKWLQYWE